jgi:hypothetical protein
MLPPRQVRRRCCGCLVAGRRSPPAAQCLDVVIGHVAEPDSHRLGLTVDLDEADAWHGVGDLVGAGAAVVGAAVQHQFDVAGLVDGQQDPDRVAAAANGARGRVEVRNAGDQVVLTVETTSLHCLDLTDIRDTAPGAALTDTNSLAEASDLIRQLTGISELDYETAKAARRDGQSRHAVSVDDLRAIDQHAQDAADRGADYISMRRLSELIGATTLGAYADLGNLIGTERPARYAPSIYRTAPESGSN